MRTSWFQRHFFQSWWKKFQKWLFQDLLEGLNWKVTKYEHVTLNELEMADNKRLEGGGGGHPPRLFRVKAKLGVFEVKNEFIGVYPFECSWIAAFMVKKDKS